MKLSELLREKAVTLDVNDLDKWGVISRLTDLLVESGQIRPEIRDAVYEGLVTREKSMSTGMENGIAIPHCCVGLVNETVVSLALVQGGVDFESIDGKPSHLVILLVTPRNKTKMHIKTLAEIAKLLNNEQSRLRILEADSPAEVLEIIRQEEKASPA